MYLKVQKITEMSKQNIDLIAIKTYITKIH